MARSAGMSRTSFTTRFRAATDEPPMAYLTELRLRRAVGYLSTTTRSVREIAHLVGYGNEASFPRHSAGCSDGRRVSTGANG